MKIENKVLREIKKHKPRGNLAHTAKIVLVALALSKIPGLKGHSERVALLSKEVAKRLKKDTNAAFYAGLFHDYGKVLLEKKLFDGHDINDKEYTEIKKHAVLGYRFFRDINHLFIALCVGMHHALYEDGYGITFRNFPNNFGARTKKKIYDIAAIVSICDFIDAYNYRGTKLKNHPDRDSKLVKILKKKYPDDHLTIEFALKAWKDLKLNKENGNAKK